MEEQVFYRELNSEEIEEIERLSNQAKDDISFDKNDREIDVLKKIRNFADKVNSENQELVEKYGYELGSLYGKMIEQKYGWKWYYIEKEGEGFHCVASQNRKACCAVHNYYYSILNDEDKTNNSILLFNMIKQSYPKDWDFTFLQ